MNTDNFFSVERLIEFGVGMGIAQQMVQSMNNALQQAYQPILPSISWQQADSRYML